MTNLHNSPESGQSSSNLFEQWALFEGGWQHNPHRIQAPYVNRYKWNEEEKIFAAGQEAERSRLKALVEAELKGIDTTPLFALLVDKSELKAIKTTLETVRLWLTPGSPTTTETDKTETA